MHGGVRGTWVIPRGASPARRVVYCHGCSLMAGDLQLYGGFVSRLAAAAGACVLFVDYRLAPEHRFPAAHEDCAAALFWAMDHGPGEERPAATCYVAGDSAGASPGLNAAIAATRRGRPPAGIALFSPFVDLTVSGASAFENDGRDPLTTTAIARACAPLYAPGMDPADPRLSPLFDDLRALPPLHIQGSMNDPLLDDAVRLAERTYAAAAARSRCTSGRRCRTPGICFRMRCAPRPWESRLRGRSCSHADEGPRDTDLPDHREAVRRHAGRCGLEAGAAGHRGSGLGAGRTAVRHQPQDPLHPARGAAARRSGHRVRVFAALVRAGHPLLTRPPDSGRRAAVRGAAAPAARLEAERGLLRFPEAE